MKGRYKGMIIFFRHSYKWLSMLLLALMSLLLFFPHVAHADGGAPNLAYVASGPKGISTIDIGQQQVTGTISVAGDPHTLVLSLDGRFLYVAQPTLNRVTMLAAKTGETICTANIPGQPSLLAFDPTPNANMLYAAGNGDASVSAIDPTNCKITRTFKTVGPVYGLALAVVATGGHGDQLWVADTNALTLFDTTSGQQLGNIPIPGGPQYVSIPQGTTVYVTTHQGSVDGIDLNTHSVTTLITGGTFGPMDYDAVTGEIYVPNLKNDQLDVLNPLSFGAKTPPEPNRTYKFTVAPQSVAITSDGQLGFIALSDGNVAMLDVPGRQIVTTIHVGGKPNFIITGLYPPAIATTPQQASTWTTVASVVAYVLVIALLLVPFLILRRLNRTGVKKAEIKKQERAEEKL
jgi:DNA-binding beta-propeller fold protein YncE